MKLVESALAKIMHTIALCISRLLFGVFFFHAMLRALVIHSIVY